MPLRLLTTDDAEALFPFVAMAAFPPDEELPPEALEMPHGRRWLDGWGDELGVAWEDDGRVVGAAWARVVDPVLAWDNTGQALPEVIISVAEEGRGKGLGRRLMEALMSRAYAEGHAGLALTVSERNPVAVRLYEHLGFEHVGRASTGLLTMGRDRRRGRVAM
jgi:GNAT superfamily N-acetyltransferase